MTKNKSVTGLSPRQLEVLTLRASGLRRQEIAAELSISPDTVRTHTQNILELLGVSNSIAAVVLAIREGDIDPASLSIRRR